MLLVRGAVVYGGPASISRDERIMNLLLLLASTVVSAQALKSEGTRSAQVTGLPAIGAVYTIANDYGDVQVTCGSGTTATAEVSWSLAGAPPATKSVTDQIQPKATKVKDRTTLKVEAPSSLPADAAVTLKVTLPPAGRVTLTSKGGLTVASCGGQLTASNVKGDVSIQGTFNELAVTVPEGDLTATLGKETLTAASSLTTQKGDITVSMPDLSADLTATGASITVSMPDLSAKPVGNTLTTKVANGGAPLTVTAAGRFILK